MCSGSKESSINKQWALTPLTPEYCEKQHGKYVKAIEVALDNTNIRNIALSGNYGVGKSSILQQVAKNQPKRVMELSLSTLGFTEDSKTVGSAPKQAITLTNQIQREIVKQLLYREQPHKAPYSRFHGIEGFNKWWACKLAVIIGFLITIVFFLSGWLDKIDNLLPQSKSMWWVLLLICCVATAITYCMLYLFHGRIHLKQLSTGPATITLDDKSVSYFDQYLDEIVYFFEVSKYDIVIFEDIDRFDDFLIFENLRALNTLLNSSLRVVGKNKKSIRFIYAIKDSIFDSKEHGQNDAASIEVERANRTKFFDLIIPVVPFITHMNAKYLMVNALKGVESKVDNQPIDLATRYIPDMRLIKNICNEFIIFRALILDDSAQKIGLTENELFAMMLYKSTHMLDFEAIRLGKSNLDDLYKSSRELVDQNIKAIIRECAGIKSQMQNIPKPDDPSYSDEEQEWLGWWFEEWQEDEPEFKRITFEEWLEQEGKRQNAELKKLKEDLKYLESADFVQLIERTDFKIKLKDHNTDVGQTFKDICTEKLKEGLAYELVRAGYINRNFTLYTSIFHGNRESAVATNFIIHHVEPRVPDMNFKLEDSDVKVVIEECGEDALGKPVIYNIDIVNYVLQHKPNAAKIILDSLASLEIEQIQFLNSYFKSDSQYIELVKRLTKISSGIFLYLVQEVDMDDTVRLELVKTALDNYDEEMDYVLDREVAKYLNKNCKTDDNRISIIDNLLANVYINA